MVARQPRRCLLPPLRIGNPDFMVNTFELQESKWERGTSLEESFCAISPLFDGLLRDLIKIYKSTPHLDSQIQTKIISSRSQDQTIHRINVGKALPSVEFLQR